MKTLLTFLFLLVGLSSLYSQINNSDIITTSETNYTSSELSYHPEIPATNTYKIIKNTTGIAISNKILGEINLYRRYDIDYLWVIDNKIEILIYYFNKPTTIELTVD